MTPVKGINVCELLIISLSIITSASCHRLAGLCMTNGHVFLQVECKKAQPKEVMLPANLAKTRAAGRGAYGELLLSGGSGGPGGAGARLGAAGGSAGGLAGSAAGSALSAAVAAAATPPSLSAASAYRYSPYPAPHHLLLTPSAAAAHAAHQGLYAHQAAANCKRAMAAAAAAAAHAAILRQPTQPPTLSYSMSDLVGLQGLDMPLYHPLPIGL